jgi:Universal stress protein family.
VVSDFWLCPSFELRHSDFVIPIMYKNILIPLENTSADETILTHIRPLARVAGAKLLLVHVADGWVARNFNQLQLAESEEMKEDRAYLEKRVRELTAEGFSCDAVLRAGRTLGRDHQTRSGEKCRSHCDDHARPPLSFSDILYGATVDKVRHEVEVPVLLLKVQR